MRREILVSVIFEDGTRSTTAYPKHKLADAVAHFEQLVLDGKKCEMRTDH